MRFRSFVPISNDAVVFKFGLHSALAINKPGRVRTERVVFVYVFSKSVFRHCSATGKKRTYRRITFTVLELSRLYNNETVLDAYTLEDVLRAVVVLGRVHYRVKSDRSGRSAVWKR